MKTYTTDQELIKWSKNEESLTPRFWDCKQRVQQNFNVFPFSFKFSNHRILQKKDLSRIITTYNLKELVIRHQVTNGNLVLSCESDTL